MGKKSAEASSAQSSNASELPSKSNSAPKHHPPATIAEASAPVISSQLFLFVLAFRIFNACSIRTFFEADEYWQGPEVAHRLVFGYGHLTWEWSEGLRSYLHPLLFAALYKIIAILRIDSALVVSLSPRLLQALFAAVADVHVYALAIRLFGRDPNDNTKFVLSFGQWALFFQLASWFNFYALVRTFSNSMEATLTIVCLYYWPWQGVPPISSGSSLAHSIRNDMIKASVAMGVCVAMRPTSIMLWMMLALLHLQTQSESSLSTAVMMLLKVTLPIGAAVNVVNVVIDRVCYGYWVIPAWNFVRFNVFQNGSAFYGTNPIYWYVIAGVPAVLLTSLVFVAIGISRSKRWDLALLIAWNIVYLSTASHKEFRFLLPILGPAHVFAAFAAAHRNSLLKDMKKKLQGDYRPPSGKRVPMIINVEKWSLWVIVMLTLGLQGPAAALFSRLHQAGTISAVEWIANERNFAAYTSVAPSVAFLMPCHQYPFYASVHRPITMTFLDCSPPLRPPQSLMKPYIDEAHRFHIWPTTFLTEAYGSGNNSAPLPSRDIDGEEVPWPPENSRSLPTHVVMYQRMREFSQSWLSSHKFKEVYRATHTEDWLSFDSRASEEVVILARAPSK